MLKDSPELTDHIGYWLRRVSNAVSGGFATKLAALDVSVAEWVFMRLLYKRAPIPPSQVAEVMALTRGGVTKIADRLINKGYLAREDDPEDGRGQRLKLTAKGNQIVPKLAALADKNEAEYFAHLSAPEKHQLMALLQKTVEALGINTVPIT